MHGLRDAAFACQLSKRKDYFLYCSPISALIVKSMNLNFEEDHIIEIKDAMEITIPASEIWPVDYRVSVTAIPAGHCPGSVM